MDVALCQRASTVGELKPNLSLALEDLDEHGPGNDLILFPELFLGGYNAQDKHHELAITRDDPAIMELRAKATQHDTNILIGAAREGHVTGTTHNSAFLIKSDDTVETYDKVHLPTFNVFEEGLHFTPGERGLLTTLPDGTRVGVAICYDLFFPEITKDLALQGADVIATISAGPYQSRTYFETVLPARALETTSFVLYCNLTGTQDHLSFAGGSMAYSPLGEKIAHAPTQKEATITTTLDLDQVPLARRKRPVLRDTRMFPWGRANDEPVPWPTNPQDLDEA